MAGFRGRLLLQNGALVGLEYRLPLYDEDVASNPRMDYETESV